MIQVLQPFCKVGKQYKKGDKVTFNKHDDKQLVDCGFAKIVKTKKKK